MYAIVKTGGKQYKVFADDVIEVEKLNAEPDSTVELEVVFIADGDKFITDADELQHARVSATIVEQFKGEKQIIFKFKKRKGYKRLRGHRQDLTKLKIEDIKLEQPKPAKKTAAKKVVEEGEAPAEKKPARKPAAKKVAVDSDAAADAKVEVVKEAVAEKKPARKPAVKKAAADADAPVEEKVAAEKKPARKPAAKKPAVKEETPAEAEAAAEEKPKRTRAPKKTVEDKKEE